MTFMDDIHDTMANQAFEAYKTLFIWLGTIAPVDLAMSNRLMGNLDALAEGMGWPKEPVPGSGEAPHENQ